MNRLILIVVGMILSGFALAWGGPQLEIPEPTFDFGVSAQSVRLKHTFWLKSVGDAPLVITRVKAQCGCTEVPVKDSVLAPGDSTALEIVFSTRNFVGKTTKKIELETNASAETVFLKILADLKPQTDELYPLTITPFNVDVSQFGQQPRRKAKFLLKNIGDRELSLSLVEMAGSYFDVVLPDKIRPGETVEGSLTVREKAADREFEGCFTFDVTGAEPTRMTLPVKRIYRILKRDDK